MLFTGLTFDLRRQFCQQRGSGMRGRQEGTRASGLVSPGQGHSLGWRARWGPRSVPGGLRCPGEEGLLGSVAHAPKCPLQPPRGADQGKAAGCPGWEGAVRQPEAVGRAGRRLGPVPVTQQGVRGLGVDPRRCPQPPSLFSGPWPVASPGLRAREGLRVWGPLPWPEGLGHRGQRGFRG